MSRVILIVMDGCGVGALPDAAEYGVSDPGSNTLRHVIDLTSVKLPVLNSLGLSTILQMPAPVPIRGAYGRCAELSKGKDSVTGHWEMMGIVTETAFPIYPNGFPGEVIAEFEQRIGRQTLGNIAASGTEIINTLGAEHVRTGKPIVYTSADSVFQVAANEDVVPIDELYFMCREAREMLVAPNNVQRVIARPFLGDEISGFARTPRRKDFPLQPPEPNVLTAINQAGKRIHGIGVIVDLFPARYFSIAERTQSNAEHLAAIECAIDSNEADFIFANCEDFDMLYGHRNDVAGFGAALEQFDTHLGRIVDRLRTDDILMITADHGNDPTTSSTDHSREYVPLMIIGDRAEPETYLGVRRSFSDIGSTVAKALRVPWSGNGSPVL